ncbi:MAG TPA: VOC family protein [Streptosporangiaceae bacterium]|nr:VOC family protein [Streptosporangiaceae bacterium]
MMNSARDNTAAAPVTQSVTPSSPDRPPTIWPTVRYPDPQAAIDFLVSVFGFEPTALIPGEEPGSYLEIELRWPHGSGGIIIADAPGPVPNWLYVVAADPDRLYARAKAAGLEITREIEVTSYGSRTFTAVDPWSVRWSFGTYPGS